MMTWSIRSMIWAGCGSSLLTPVAAAIRRSTTGSAAVVRDRTLLDMVREGPPAAHLPMVLLGAVHYLVLGGAGDLLAEVYAGRSVTDPAPLFRDFCLAHPAELLEVMASRHTQTNEVGRSALVGPALSWVAERFGGPLRLIDVGSSAGLNLWCDRYQLDYGDRGVT